MITAGSDCRETPHSRIAERSPAADGIDVGKPRVYPRGRAMTEPDPTGSVFLSYASQDAEAAAHICEALQSVGVKVWLDKSELRGGDAWDAQIKKRIHDCV